MRFVPKFHKRLIISLTLFSCTYLPISIWAFFSSELDEMGRVLIESVGIYIMVLIALFFSWLALNLVEMKVVYERENENYYRDLIKSVSPAQLSYIDDYGVESKKDIIATILKLHLKGNLKIDNKKIELISKFKMKDEDYYNLSKSEVAVLDCISKGMSPLKIQNTFKRLLMEDLKDEGFLEKGKSTPPHFYIEMVLQFIYGVLLIFYSKWGELLISPLVYCFGMFFIVYSILLPIIVEGSIFKDEGLGVYKKLTSKANEIRLKLTGLKLFLRDYSYIKNRETKEIELWDEYIIYSVILNDNKKIQKEIAKMIKRQFK